MGRNKIKDKNEVMSVSILPQQKMWIQSHSTFDFSKYVQISLQQIMDQFEEFETIKLEKTK